jgi:hypothetical protein
VNAARAGYILDYADWDAIQGRGLGGGAGSSGWHDSLEIEVQQIYPLSILVRALYDWVGVLTPALQADSLTLRGRTTIENHYPLYLDDRGL